MPSMPGQWRRPGFHPFLRTQDLAVLPPDTTTTLRAPVYSQLSSPKSIIPDVVVAANLLLTLLAPTSAPFNQDVWASPQPSVNQLAEVAPPNTLLSKLAPPFNQDDWPIQPKLARQREADAPVNILPSLPPGSLPFGQDDWPIIQPTPRVSVGFESRNLLTPFLPPLPFSPGDWPSLQRVLGRQAVDPLNLLTTTLAPAVAPFAVNSWPIQAQVALLRPADATPDTLLGLPPGKLAFSQASWPIQPSYPVQRLADAPRNITINLPAPQVAAGGIKHKRKWRRGSS